MAAIGITVSGETEVSIPDNDFFIFECAGFVLVAIGMWFYMWIVKKYRYIFPKAAQDPQDASQCNFWN